MYHNTSGPGPERADATLNSARSIAIHRVVHAPAMKLTVSRVDSSHSSSSSLAQVRRCR